MAAPLEKSLLERIYATALKIRLLEEAIAEEYPKREMRSPTHLCIGQEAIPAGVCAHLTPNDLLYAYYRSHGWYIAKGGSTQGILDELHGKATGCSRGFGGSMHLIDLSVGLQGTTAVVAGAMPHAVGAAFTTVYRNEKRIVVCAFGDGATEEGLFQESLMFASLRRLPLVFICENNGLATNTYQADRQPPIPIYQRAEAFGVRSVQVDGNDAIAVANAARDAVECARRGDGPSLIECITYRILEHCGPNSDLPLGFRTAEEIEEWKAKDPILRLEQGIDPAVQKQLRQKLTNEIQQAFEQARLAPFPTSLLPRDLTATQMES